MSWRQYCIQEILFLMLPMNVHGLGLAKKEEKRVGCFFFCKMPFISICVLTGCFSPFHSSCADCKSPGPAVLWAQCSHANLQQVLWLACSSTPCPLLADLAWSALMVLNRARIFSSRKKKYAVISGSYTKY